MIVLSIEPPIPELMERLRAHERLMIERLFEVETRIDFRAVLQMRLTLETMRCEIVLRSFAKGTRRRVMAEQSADTMQGRRFRQHRPL